VARGYLYEGHMPTLEYIDSEWHELCYQGEIQHQRLPFICSACHREIKDGQLVTYVTVGSVPEGAYLRAERPGYEVASIKHVKCPERR
jgi:hypothetical protein